MALSILITGGAGFIGSNFIRQALEKKEWKLVNIDKLTYAGNPENLEDLESDDNYEFIHGSITESGLIKSLFEQYKFDGIINFAAESHVDRSILDASPFIDTNVKGTLVLLDAAKKYGTGKFLQISTDEVYGSLGPMGKFSEGSPVKPNSPYSASKAAADHLVFSYFKTYGLPALITRCSNNYGPYQFPEKLIPLMIENALDNKKLPVYGDGLNVRDWIHVYDHNSAIMNVFENGKAGNIYNIGADSEMTNIEIIKTIIEYLGKSENLINFVKDRPGHDRRYAIDNKKIKTELNWKPEIDFKTGLKRTIDWYINNRRWTRRVKTGEYREYYKKQYGS